MAAARLAARGGRAVCLRCGHGQFGIKTSLFATAALGAVGIAAFASVAVWTRRDAVVGAEA